METQFQKPSTATQNAIVPEVYPTQDAVATKFGVTHDYVSKMLLHYEFVTATLDSATISTRVELLPEGVTREVRRAPADIQPKLLQRVIESYKKAEETGNKDEALTVRAVASLVDSFLPKEPAKHQPKPPDSSTHEKASPEPATFPAETPEPRKPAKAVPYELESAEEEYVDEIIDNVLKRPLAEDEENQRMEVSKRREECTKQRNTTYQELERYYPLALLDAVINSLPPDLVSTEKVTKVAKAVIDCAFSRLEELELINDVFEEAKKWL